MYSISILLFLYIYYQEFKNRVDEKVVRNYYKVIKCPMWLSLMLQRTRNREYKSQGQFLSDIDLIVSNCKQFNPETSPSGWLRDSADALKSDMLHKLSEYKTKLEQYETYLQHM